MADFTIAQLQDINVVRCARWHGVEDWTPLEWAGAMCGEAGEAANFAKKLKRIETEMQNNDKRTFGSGIPKPELAQLYRSSIGLEVADTIIYGVLLCARVGVSAEDAVRAAFNNKSEEYGFPERLP